MPITDHLPQPEEEVDGDDEEVDESLVNTSQVSKTKKLFGFPSTIIIYWNFVDFQGENTSLTEESQAPSSAAAAAIADKAPAAETKDEEKVGWSCLWLIYKIFCDLPIILSCRHQMWS